jgi:hypothetical protein
MPLSVTQLVCLLTPLIFNKIRMGLFIRISCHFGINELYSILDCLTRSVGNRVGSLFEKK